MIDQYSLDEQRLLLSLSHQTLDVITHGQPPPVVELYGLPSCLCEPRACFVTLRRRVDAMLRGCTGTLVARRPLAKEVVSMTVQTAFNDPRFRPVTAPEVSGLHVEISVLTPSEPLDFDGPDDLLAKLCPGVDGVTIKLDDRRATFLPQVWESYPDPRIFLSLLSEKMGRSPDAWRSAGLEVETYRAIVIEEPH